MSCCVSPRQEWWFCKTLSVLLLPVSVSSFYPLLRKEVRLVFRSFSEGDDPHVAADPCVSVGEVSSGSGISQCHLGHPSINVISKKSFPGSKFLWKYVLFLFTQVSEIGSVIGILHRQFLRSLFTPEWHFTNIATHLVYIYIYIQNLYSIRE